MTRPQRYGRSCTYMSFILAFLLFISSFEFAHAGKKSSQAQRQPQCRIVTPQIFEAQCPSRDQRHDSERQRVLHEIDRRHGRWNNKHPRWSILEALHGFDRYREIAGAEIDRFEGLYKHVPKNHKKIYESKIHYAQNFNKARSLLDENVKLTQAIVENGLAYHNISRSELDAFIKDFEGQDQKQKDNKFKMLRTHTSHALKHMVRDWSLPGHDEREATFPYILSAISDHLSTDPHKEPYSVLVPGAGLGRLAHEIALLDPGQITVTTNEKDEFMNLAYRYMTSLPYGHQHTLHPFLESWSHARSREDIHRRIPIPDPSPAAKKQIENVLLIPGDFTLHPFTPPYNAIATLFFIDTARNLLAYLEKIHTLLQPGGIWINVGPLLYGSAPFVQLTLEEVFAVAEAVGFVVERRMEREVVYNFNGTVLYRNGYVAEYWVARKKEQVEEDGKGWWRW